MVTNKKITEASTKELIQIHLTHFIPLTSSMDKLIDETKDLDLEHIKFTYLTLRQLVNIDSSVYYKTIMENKHNIKF